ncbi:hypothetical protein C1X47_06530 [Pseudomonas sp. MPR-R2A2]|nr:hypothetical protein C1X47_06530 [Pseudomonas sp. MPR-R2A2]
MFGGSPAANPDQNCLHTGILWRGSLLPLGCEAAPKSTAATQPDGSEPPRHKCSSGPPLCFSVETDVAQQKYFSPIPAKNLIPSRYSQ